MFQSCSIEHLGFICLFLKDQGFAFGDIDSHDCLNLFDDI